MRGSARAPDSKKLLISRQPESTSVDASAMNADLSSPISGKSCCPSVRHSDDKSYERCDSASRNLANRSISGKLRSSSSAGLH